MTLSSWNTYCILAPCVYRHNAIPVFRRYLRGPSAPGVGWGPLALTLNSAALGASPTFENVDHPRTPGGWHGLVKRGGGDGGRQFTTAWLRQTAPSVAPAAVSSAGETRPTAEVAYPPLFAGTLAIQGERTWIDSCLPPTSVGESGRGRLFRPLPPLAPPERGEEEGREMK